MRKSIIKFFAWVLRLDVLFPTDVADEIVELVRPHVRMAETMTDVTGEFKRHWVLARMLKRHTVPEREVALAIEIALDYETE